MAAPYVIPSGVLAAEGRAGANERLTFGHIGVGGMGGYHLGDMVGRMQRGEVNIAAVCDIDDKRLENASRTAGPQADCYRDYRYVLDRKDIDAVVIATPDHWHAVQTVHAAERGKHVYVEKPACCTIEEGKAMIAAANRAKHRGAGRLAGAQPARGVPGPPLPGQRQHRQGHAGRLLALSPARRAAFTPDSDPPAELDWDLWLGPLRWRPFNRGYCHGTFRWLMESGGGQIRDRGAHVMSCAMWWMDADGTGPVDGRGHGRSAAARPVGFGRQDQRQVHVQESRLGAHLEPAGRAGAARRTHRQGAGRPDFPPRLRRGVSRRQGHLHATGAATAAPGRNGRPASGNPAPARRTSTRAPATRRIGSKGSRPARRRS